MLTSDQIRGARSFLKWTGKELSDRSGVGFSTIMRLETEEGVPKAQAKTLEALRIAFEKADIEFIGTPENGAGVRWKLK